MNKNRKYFPDLVKQEFEVPQPNLHWYSDFTEIETKQGKLHFLLLIDGCYNEIIKFKISKNKQSSTDTVRTFESALKTKRIKEQLDEQEPALLIHTDRGSQFTSDIYFQFTNKYKKRFRPSMSPMASPKNNAVMERFLRTFKGLKISNETIFESIERISENTEQNIDLKQLRTVFQKFVDFYNEEKQTKKAPKGANYSVRIFEEGKEFLKEPIFNQGYSAYSMEKDDRRIEIDRYKLELIDVWTEINEALPNNISFLEAKPILLSKLRTIEDKIDQQSSMTLSIKGDTMDLSEGQRDLIEGQKLTMTAIGQVAMAIETLREEVQELKNKRNQKKANKIQLRDPIYQDHYGFFMVGAGQGLRKLKNIRSAQIRIIYTILYYLGLRLNETKLLTKNDLLLAIQTGELNIIHTKTNTCQKHVLPIVGKQKLNQLRPEIDLIFDKYGFEYLGNSKCFSNHVFNEVNFIRFINEDMIFTCKKYGILANFTSHSFRVGYITKLLRTLSVQKVAAIIGHKDIESTMSYQRYVINKEEIQDALKDSFS